MYCNSQYFFIETTSANLNLETETTYCNQCNKQFQFVFVSRRATSPTGQLSTYLPTISSRIKQRVSDPNFYRVDNYCEYHLQENYFEVDSLTENIFIVCLHTFHRPTFHSI